MKFVTTLRQISEEEFKEEEHPRAGDGKFTSKGGGVSKKTKVSKDKKTDNADRIENVKDNYDIKRMLKAGVQPNEMDLQLAELERKRHELGKIKTERTFKVDLGIGHEETEITGTPEYEKVWKELGELRDKVSKKEEDEYRKSYGWKEGDPFRWTPHNDDPDTADTSGDYGSDYTYKHLTKEESDVIMRRWWNDGMDRKERENKYDYIHGSYINYLNEDDKTPQELEEDMEEDRSDVSDYFFFTDKKTNKQFRGTGMTKAEIKKRAKHGIGSYHEDNRYVGRPDREVIVYDRPLDYDKFHSKRISAYNFGEKGSRTDKLWDDLGSDEQSRIKSDYKFDGEFYIGWQEEQEKLFYGWKSKQGNKDGDKVNGKHSELYSEYPELSKQEIVLDENDYKLMDKKYPKWREDLDSHLYEDWQKEDKKKELMRKRGMQTYFQQDPIERKKYVGVLFDGMRAYDKDMLAGDAFDYEAPNDPTEDDELKWKDLSDQEQSDVVREVENDADDESPRYEIEETFQKSLPKKDIGFDYDRGIPKSQTTTILKSWANRMENISYEQGAKAEGKDIIIPQYPKAKQRTVKEHQKQVKQLNSKLKEKTQKNMSDKEKWNWQQETLLEDVEEFRDYVRKNEPDLNLDLTFYKMRWDKDDWTQGDPPTTEKEWRKHFIEDSLRVGDKMVHYKVRQLRGLSSLLDQNPKLDEKYQHILDKTDKLNHDNYDLFIKTPEFYRGTSTEELDHYLNHGNTGKMWDWSEKTYPFTALTLDKSSAQSPSEQRIDWKEEDGKLSGGKVVITYEGDSVREKAVPVQYNTQSSINHSGTDASERIGFPYNMEAYAEREVRMNQNSEIPKIKELNFGINIGKYKDRKVISKIQRKMLLKKYLPLVGGDKSKIKFYKFVEHSLESYAVEEFREEEHPREDDGKFADKDGSNSRVERQKSILQQEIEYLRLSLKEESKKYRPFEKVSDEDRAIRWKNKSVGEKIKELVEELNSTDTAGLPFIPLKPNTHKIETIDNGMYISNSDSEPEYESEREAMKSWSGMKFGLHQLEGFKKGNSTIKVSIDIKEKNDYGINREVAEKQINIARIMWNSLSDEERDSIHNLTIEKRPSIKYFKNEKGEDVMDSKSLHEASILGSWSFNDNELTIRIDPSYKSEMIKGTFIHEVGHSMYHKLLEKHPDRIKKWKEMVEKIPPTTKYGKYNLNRWKDGAKQLNQMEKDNWEWQEVVQRDYGVPKRDDDGNIVMVRQHIAEQDREIFRNNALSNVAFYKDLYFNEIHSEVHMYMMGQQKRGHMKKTGKATKGITKFVEAYRLLHDLPKMEEPLVVGEAEEDSPVMEVEDITESIGEVVIYLDEYFERVLNEDEGEYEFVIELNDDMTIKRYSISSMWEETATEEFREEEHPREEDGKFTDKDGGGSTALSHTNVRKLFDTYYREDVKVDLEKQVEDVEDVKKDLEELIKVFGKMRKGGNTRKFPATIKFKGQPARRYQSFDEYADFHINAKRKAIDREMEALKDIKDIILTFNEKPYVELGNKPDTHKIGIGGFKNSVKAPKNLLFKDDWGRKYGDPIVQGGITKEEWGGTYIDSSLNKRSSKLSKRNYEVIKEAWNQLSDEDRKLVDILKFRYSNTAKKNMGLHSDRLEVKMDGVMKIIQPRTVEITLSDSLTTPTSAINTLMHEVAHAKWSVVEGKYPERCKKFSDAIRKLQSQEYARILKETGSKKIALARSSPTPYVSTYINDAKEAEDGRKEQMEEIKSNREHDKLKEKYDEMDEAGKKSFNDFTENRIKGTNERIDREVKNADLLYGNEAHSEFFATLNSPTTNYGHRIKRKMMEEVAKLYKELHDE